MLDVAVAYDRYRFLGDEFLTWLWFLIENDPESFRKADKNILSLEIGNRIVLENRNRDALERITIRGDEANLDEGMVALSKGALVSEISLVYKTAENQWQFSVKGESLNISSLKTPKVALPENSDDYDGFVLEKAYLFDNILNLLENIYTIFIKIRISNDWNGKVMGQIKAWIKSELRK